MTWSEILKKIVLNLFSRSFMILAASTYVFIKGGMTADAYFTINGFNYAGPALKDAVPQIIELFTKPKSEVPK